MINKNKLVRIPYKINDKGDIKILIGVIDSITNHCANIKLLGKYRGFTTTILKTDIQYCEGY